MERLATPIALADIGLSRAPQSWRYLPQQAVTRMIMRAVFTFTEDNALWKLCPHCYGAVPVEVAK